MKNEIKQLLEKILLNREFGLDRFDANYIDDFQYIMRENYSIDTIKDKDKNKYFKQLVELLQMSDTDEIGSIQSKLKNFDIDYTKFGPLISEDGNNTNYGVTYDNSKNINDILLYQKQYSIKSNGTEDRQSSESYNSLWDREGYTNFGKIKTDIMNDLLNRKILNKESLILALGPRWYCEIEMFRTANNMGLGFPNSFGLDLFSYDENLVYVGDMHDMPFEDNSFDMIYQRNTFNKSYDLRKSLTECIRVLKPGGILMSDDCMDYTVELNSISRTNITGNKWYTSFLKDNIDEIIISEEIEVGSIISWINKVGLYVARIKK